MSFRRISLLALIACLVAVMSFSVSARADDWADKQEDAHKDDWNISTSPDGAMYQILGDLANFSPPEKPNGWEKNACESAALNQAWNAWGRAQGKATGTVWKNTFKDIGSNLWGLGKEGLVKYITGTVQDAYKDLGKEKARELLKKFFGNSKVKSDVYKWAGTQKDNCSFVLYVIVDAPNSKATVLVHGNCNCTFERCYKQEQSVKLAGWEAKLEGDIRYHVSNGKIEYVSLNDIRKVELKGICDGCDKDHWTTGPKKGGGLTDGPTGGGTTGGGKTDGGSGGITDGPTGGGKAKPEEKTCTPCESIAKQLDDAETKRDNLKNSEQNLKNNLRDVEDGRRPKSDQAGLERDLKTVQDAIKEQEERIKELEGKKDKCEQKKCGHHASRLIEEGTTGYASYRAADEASHARGGEDGYETGDRPRTDDRRVDDAEPQRDSHGCVASAERTEKLPSRERAAAREADKARLDAEVSQREAEEKKVSKKYDDAIAELERRRYGNFVTSDETYTSQKTKLRSKRKEETESYHDATVRARECRDNYLKASQ